MKASPAGRRLLRSSPAAGQAATLLGRLRPRRVAVFRALHLGDMLCALPALRALRAALPNASITLVGLPWARELPERFDAYLDDFLPFPGFAGLPEQKQGEAAALVSFVAEAKARRFDLAIQLHGDGRITNQVVAMLGARTVAGFSPRGERPAENFLPYPEKGPEIHRLLELVRFVGAPPQGDALEFPIRPADRAELAAFEATARLPRGGYICLHPGARARERRWPPEAFAAVGDALHAASGLPVVVTGSGEESALVAAVRERMHAPSIDAALPISAGALAALLSKARLLVCSDTGVAHLAAALRLPSVVIYRASDMARWAPLDRRLHRRVWDPAGRAAERVLAEARSLLAQRPGLSPARRPLGATAPARAPSPPPR